MSTATDNRKRKQRLAIGLLIVIVIGTCAGRLYAEYKGEQNAKTCSSIFLAFNGLSLFRG